MGNTPVVDDERAPTNASASALMNKMVKSEQAELTFSKS